MKIPKRIHRIWYNGDIPIKFHKWMSSWEGLCPSFEFKLWDATSLREAVERYEPDYLSVYDMFDWDIKRIDFARYVILKHEGGIYSDLDVELYRPIEKFMHFPLTLTLEAPGHVLSNALMFSEPGHPFWDYVLRATTTNFYKPTPEATGPAMLTDVWQETIALCEGTLRVLPPHMFQPFLATDTDRWFKPVPEDTYGSHWFAASWYKDMLPEMNYKV